LHKRRVSIKDVAEVSPDNQQNGIDIGRRRVIFVQIGSNFLLVLLALAMYLTRGVDWYSVNAKGLSQ
jgi:hypothetical protein